MINGTGPLPPTLPRKPARLGFGVLASADWLLAAAPVAYFLTLMSPWAQLDVSPPSYDVAPDGSVKVLPPTGEEILYGNDTIRAIGTPSLLVCLALLVAVAAWALAPAWAYRPVRRPLGRRAIAVTLAIWPAVQTTLAVWQAATGSLFTPLPTAYVSAGIAVAVLAITVAQYRAESRRREMRDLAEVMAEANQPELRRLAETLTETHRQEMHELREHLRAQVREQLRSGRAEPNTTAPTRSSDERTPPGRPSSGGGQGDDLHDAV